MRLSVHLVGKCAMLRATESSPSRHMHRRQLLCTAPRLPVVPIKQQQCCQRHLPSLWPHPALRIHQHRCFATSPMQSPQDAEDVGRRTSWDVKMLYDGAPTKASDSEQHFPRPCHNPTYTFDVAGPLDHKLPGPLEGYAIQPVLQLDYMAHMPCSGECPLCMREVNMLKRRDADAGRIAFVNIASSDYQAEENAGISYEKAMGEIHAVLPSGEVVKNIEVFRRLYEAVGLGWVYGFTRYEPLRKAADAVYSVWARFRLQLTGRSDLQTILAEKSAKTCRQASDM